MFKEIACADSRVKLVQEISSDSEITALSAKSRQWAQIGNQAIDSALETECSHILYIESDLCFPLDLLEQLISRDVDIIAPVVMLGSSFYDSWGFRDLNGKKISDMQFFPFYTGELVELSSVGSCVLFRSDIFRAGIRFAGNHHNGLFVGVCNEARSNGFRVYADPTVSIIHPTSLWRSQIWRVVNITVTRINGTSYPIETDLNVAGFYAFILTINRNVSSRTLSLILDETGEYPPVPDTIGLDPSEKVRLSKSF